RVEGLHKLGVKRRHLRTECLIFLALGGKQRRDGRRHLIGARGQHRRRPSSCRRVGRAERRFDTGQIRCRRRHQLRRRDHKRHPPPPSKPRTTQPVARSVTHRSYAKFTQPVCPIHTELCAQFLRHRGRNELFQLPHSATVAAARLSSKASTSALLGV